MLGAVKKKNGSIVVAGWRPPAIEGVKKEAGRLRCQNARVGYHLTHTLINVSYYTINTQALKENIKMVSLDAWSYNSA